MMTAQQLVEQQIGKLVLQWAAAEGDRQALAAQLAAVRQELAALKATVAIPANDKGPSG